MKSLAMVPVMSSSPCWEAPSFPPSTVKARDAETFSDVVEVAVAKGARPPLSLAIASAGAAAASSSCFVASDFFFKCSSL